jgi:phage FluMu protein Com
MNIHDVLWDRQDFSLKKKPHGWIQWKGTSVCMDLHCSCGKLSHLDAEFAYAVKCPHCKKSYFVSGFVEMVPMSDQESAQWMSEGYADPVEAKT